MNRLKLKLWAWWVRFKLWWPYMTKVRHGREISTARHDARVTAESKSSQNEIELRKIMNDVVPKLIHASVSKDFSADRYRLQLDLDPFIIRDAFMWGNDERALRYFCEAVSIHVFREMRGMNNHRYANELPRENPRLVPRNHW